MQNFFLLLLTAGLPILSSFPAPYSEGEIARTIRAESDSDRVNDHLA
jgi:hypothetical protein